MFSLVEGIETPVINVHHVIGLGDDEGIADRLFDTGLLSAQEGSL